MGRKKIWGPQESTETIGDASLTIMRWVDKLRGEMDHWQKEMIKKRLSGNPRYADIAQIHTILEHEYDNLLMLSLGHLPPEVLEVTITFTENRSPQPSRERQAAYAVVRLRAIHKELEKMRRTHSENWNGLGRTLNYMITDLPKISRAIDSINFPRRYEAS